MRSLKNTLFIATLFIGSLTFGQDDFEKLKTSFANSIEEEKGGRYDRAIQVIQQVYTEGSYECNMRLGWLNYLSNKIDESITYYKKAVKIKPNSTEALWGLATPLSIKQKWVELNDVYLAILKLDSKNSLANYYVGLYYYAEKNYAKAKTYFDTALELNPMDSELLRMSGWTHYFLKSKETSIALFNRALVLSSTNQSSLEGLALAKKL